MAEIIPNYDRLPQGTGYANVPTPTTDAAPDKVSSTQHCLDSTNDPINVQVVSIATTSIDGPMNPAPYWNSGEKESLDILG